MTDRPQDHDRLVHASVLDAQDIQMCKKADGKDWLLGRGSYGMVSPVVHYLTIYVLTIRFFDHTFFGHMF